MNVLSKFSVIGLGDHEASLLGTLADIGTNRGLYYYVSSQNMSSEAESKINAFFMEAHLETI
jgi:hypothetical protein